MHVCVHVCVGAHVHACTRARVRACLDITAHVAQLLRNHVHACLDISAHIVQRDSVPDELPQNNVYLGVVGIEHLRNLVLDVLLLVRGDLLLVGGEVLDTLLDFAESSLHVWLRACMHATQVKNMRARACVRAWLRGVRAICSRCWALLVAFMSRSCTEYVDVDVDRFG